MSRFPRYTSAKPDDRLDRGMRAQGIDRKKLIYHSNLQPWLSYWGVFWNIIFILVNGLTSFWDFNASDFLTACTCPMSFIPWPRPLRRLRLD